MRPVFWKDNRLFEKAAGNLHFPVVFLKRRKEIRFFPSPFSKGRRKFTFSLRLLEKTTDNLLFPFAFFKRRPTICFFRLSFFEKPVAFSKIRRSTKKLKNFWPFGESEVL